DKANAVMAHVRAQLGALPGQSFAAGTVSSADEFAYDDPVDGARSEGQGLRIQFSSGARVVFRLSGTGTEGATLRVYLEAYEADAAKVGGDPGVALADVIESAEAISKLRDITGRSGPDVTT
ncbi:MAG: alpha-D-glucose phosphate-specific phosphoglucomutase, partial [Pseudomonadota bacterium]